LRSITKSWRILPPLGKDYLLVPVPKDAFSADFRRFGSLARPLLMEMRHADGRRGKSKDQVQGDRKMFSFDRFARVATAAVGALVISTLSITAAVGPVKAQTPTASWIGAAQFKAPANV
jgi:hypothetical protein